MFSGIKVLSVVIFLFIYQITAHQTHVKFTSKSGQACLFTRECPHDEYCTGEPVKKIYGNCEKKYENFCQNEMHCEEKGFICQNVNYNHGKCEKIDVPDKPTHTKETNSEIDMFIPHLTEEEYNKRPGPDSQTLYDLEGTNSICGNEYIVQEQHTSPNNVSKDSTAACSTSYCNIPANRNAYTSGKGVYLKIQWLVFKCGTWYTQAAERIAESTFDINRRYATVGIQFNSYLSLYPCAGTDGTGQYTTFSTAEVTTAIQKERGSNYKDEGALMVVAGTPDSSNLNGFFYFPSGGRGFMNTRVVAKGYSTLSHEIGHGFGLYHTFNGVSENSCGACRETVASDDTGDFCADTPPVVKNWDCKSPLAGTDSCDASRTSWDPNPYKNLMSYGNCRDEFTPCQIKRIRCYHDKFMTFLKPDGAFSSGFKTTISFASILLLVVVLLF